jgi:hypothetical protein
MSEHGKHSLQDSHVDCSKIRMGLNCLKALKEELDGIEELHTISDHVLALENILKGAKKPVCSIFHTL